MWGCLGNPFVNDTNLGPFVRASSFVHSKKYKTNYKTINENWIEYDMIYPCFKWEP